MIWNITHTQTYTKQMVIPRREGFLFTIYFFNFTKPHGLNTAQYTNHLTILQFTQNTRVKKGTIQLLQAILRYNFEH